MQAAAPFLSGLFSGGSNNSTNGNNTTTAGRDRESREDKDTTASSSTVSTVSTCPSTSTKSTHESAPSSIPSSPTSRSPVRSRPPTSSDQDNFSHLNRIASTTTTNTVLTSPPGRPLNPLSALSSLTSLISRDRERDKDRKTFNRKPSLHFTRRRASSRSSSPSSPVTQAPGQPPLPSIQLAGDGQTTSVSGPESIQQQQGGTAPAEGLSKMLSRGAVTPISGYPIQGPATAMLMSSATAQQNELAVLHQHIQETVNKRISTLDYLRKAHEGHIYWFNTLLFDKPDLQRMPYFDSRKLARRATNYLLLGISLPAVIDLNSNHPVDFLRSLNHLLTEFDSFQQNHSETGQPPSTLARARLPQMFRRAAAPVSKGRRSSSAAGRDTGDSLSGGMSALELVDSNTGTVASGTSASATSSATGTAPGSAGPTAETAGVMAFSSPAAHDSLDLLPGEEYTHLLTPTLPFDPDFFETFATLCDVLIDTYNRLLALVPTPQACSGPVGELFAKADSKVRKLLVQGVIKEFEETSRAGARAEVAGIGRVVLSGLM